MTYKYGTTMEMIKVEAIERTLERTGGNKYHAAKILSVSVRFIRNYVSLYPQLSLYKLDTRRGPKPRVERPLASL